MKKRLLRFMALMLCGIVALSYFGLPAIAAEGNGKDTPDLALNADSALLMEYETGRVLYEQNADEQLPPASITKIMTLLLVMEALDGGRVKLDDPVSVSDTAASMGGSQIFLEPGEQMSLQDMLKSVVIASANDAAAALAEHIAGSLEAFVEMMNRRAAELGMTNTHFENTNGLDDTTVAHYTSARDVAIMSRALIAHPLILEYSSIWMDTVRNGSFGLTNTNRLVRFYPGATGLKTGSTSKAGFCISATAKRDGMHLIAVIMGSPTRDIRNEEAKKLLDYGFANYALYTEAAEELAEVPVLGGVRDVCQIKTVGFSELVKKGQAASVTRKINMAQALTAPIKNGDTVGSVSYYIGDTLIGQCDIIATEDINKISWFDLFFRMVRSCFCNGG